MADLSTRVEEHRPGDVDATAEHGARCWLVLVARYAPISDIPSSSSDELAHELLRDHVELGCRGICLLHLELGARCCARESEDGPCGLLHHLHFQLSDEGPADVLVPH